jgi:holo-[acyl-carrier protein] synthase
MEPDIKRIQQIIGKFLPDDIIFSEATPIDNTVIQGSVKLHLMYGELADIGYKIDDFRVISTFGDLLNAIKDGSNVRNNADQSKPVTSIDPVASNQQDIPNNSDHNFKIGVDIIKTNQLPVVDDFRENSFYTENFSQEEISYCLLKSSPIHSFAGKFAAKEAIVKSDSNFKGKPFKDIQIKNNKLGQPYYSNFSLSISHDEEYAVAIAIKNGIQSADSKNDKNETYLKNLEAKVNKQEIELEKLRKKVGSGKIKRWLIILFALNIGIIAFLLYKHLRIS